MSAWVIGGTSGIGKATAELIQVGEEFVFATGEEVDVTERSKVQSFYRKNGPFDKIVYSAGVNHPEWLYDSHISTWDDTFQVNVRGFYYVMAELTCNTATVDQPCRVVVVSSDADHRPMRTSMAYCASKAALTMAARVAARELADYGHRINVVRPGMTSDTGMTAHMDMKIPPLRGWSVEHMLEYEMAQAVIPSRVTPEEVAQVIVSTLFGPDHLNGAVIDVNGGR